MSNCCTQGDCLISKYPINIRGGSWSGTNCDWIGTIGALLWTPDHSSSELLQVSLNNQGFLAVSIVLNLGFSCCAIVITCSVCATWFNTAVCARWSPFSFSKNVNTENFQRMQFGDGSGVRLSCQPVSVSEGGDIFCPNKKS